MTDILRSQHIVDSSVGASLAQRLRHAIIKRLAGGAPVIMNVRLQVVPRAPAMHELEIATAPIWVDALKVDVGTTGMSIVVQKS